MLTRSELDNKTVATIRKLMSTPRGLKALAMVRSRYYRAMDKMGFDSATTYHGFKDCADVAELQQMSEA